MYLLEVIPIAKGVGKESLSYFAKEPIAPGTLVFVPLRTRVVPALVLESKSARSMKSQLRGSSFSLKKISNRKSFQFFPKEYIEAAKRTAEYAGSTTGAVLYSMIPQTLFEELGNKRKFPKEHARSVKKTGLQGDKLIFQAETQERLSRYRGMIRESFAQGLSLMIVVPTLADVAHFEAEVARGVQDYTFSFHSALSKRELFSRYDQLRNTEHPIFIIGTPQFVSLMREDVYTIIIEKENARSYKLMQRPHIDTRIFIERYAEARQLRLIFAGIPLRMETLFRYREQELHDVIPPKLRLLTGAETKLIDMKEERKEKKTFSIFSNKLESIILQTIENNAHCFLFTARRGLAPVTVCKDCGSTVMSEDKTVPMILQKTDRGNAFVSHRTGEMRSARERCRVCTSWRLEALGIGIERAIEALEKLVDSRHIFRTDKDTTPTHKKVKAVIEQFYRTPGSILVGTELTFPYLIHPIENCAVVSADTLLSLPEWRSTERVFSLILSLREISTKNLLVQTRKDDAKVITLALSGNIGDFYRDEIMLREEFSYPPFSVLVKISAAGTPARAREEMKALEEALHEEDMHIYPAAFQMGKGKEVRHALLRIPKSEWPDKRILKKLLALPLHFAIDVDPENLL